MAALLLAGPGCATPLSGFQPAHVGSKGTYHAEAGIDVSVPAGAAATAIDTARTLAEAARSEMLSPAAQQQLLAAGASLALNPPLLVQHVGLAHVLADGWELGLRYSSGGWRLGGRHQILHQEDRGYDLSVGLGLQRFGVGVPVGDVIGILQVDDFVRWNLDVPVTIGKQGTWYRLWGGPRLVLSRFDGGLSLHLPATPRSSAQTVTASIEGTGLYAGAQGGFAIGYRKLFVGLEITVARFISTAQMVAADDSTETALDALVVYPGIALMGEF